VTAIFFKHFYLINRMSRSQPRTRNTIILRHPVCYSEQKWFYVLWLVCPIYQPQHIKLQFAPHNIICILFRFRQSLFTQYLRKLCSCLSFLRSASISSLDFFMSLSSLHQNVLVINPGDASFFCRQTHLAKRFTLVVNRSGLVWKDL
jgi:hypothetical protein